MVSHSSPLFCGTELAGRIERAETEMTASGAEAARTSEDSPNADAFALPIAGGVASFARPGSPLNKVVGLGFVGPPGEDELNAVEHAFAACRSPVQIELSNLADPAIGALLTGRDYRLIGFENVLGLRLGGERRGPPPPGIAISRCGPHELDDWLEIAVAGFASPDQQGVQSHESFSRQTLAQTLIDLISAAGFVLLLAQLEGTPAGAASFRIADGIAQLAGAATLPAHRRRGVQTAFMAARLALAEAAGCDIAVVTTQPGSRSQENASRQGFSLLYTRAIFLK